jgi:hypothetical protein
VYEPFGLTRPTLTAACWFESSFSSTVGKASTPSDGPILVLKFCKTLQAERTPTFQAFICGFKRLPTAILDVDGFSIGRLAKPMHRRNPRDWKQSSQTNNWLRMVNR